MRKLLVLLAAGVLSAVALVIALVANGLSDDTAPRDVAVVLGNQVFPDGTPSPRLAGPLDRALDLYRSGMVKAILVSGATGVEGVPEGDAMKRYLTARGVPEAHVLVDNEGVDTWATARNTERILQEHGLHSAIVVSQFFHIPRTRLAFARHGMAVGSAHARHFEWRDVYSTARELPAYASYLLRPDDQAPPASS